MRHSLFILLAPLVCSCEHAMIQNGATSYLMEKHDRRLKPNSPNYDLPTGELTDYISENLCVVHTQTLSAFKKLGYLVGSERIDSTTGHIRGRTPSNKNVIVKTYREKEDLTHIVISVSGMDMGATAQQLLETVKDELVIAAQP